MTDPESSTRGLTFGVLGPVVAWRDGVPLAIGGTEQRTMLALLILNPGRVVSVDRIATALWGDQRSDDASGTLQVYASNLRKALGDERGGSVLSYERPEANPQSERDKPHA